MRESNCFRTKQRGCRDISMSLQRALYLDGAVSVSRGVRREARPRYRCYLLALYEIAKATSVVPKQDSAKGESESTC